MLLMNHLSLGVEIDGGLCSMLMVRPPGVEMMSKWTRSNLSRPLRGRITSRDVLNSLADVLFLPQAQFLPNLNGLDCKSIFRSLRDFSFSGNNLSFNEGHSSMYRDDTFALPKKCLTTTATTTRGLMIQSDTPRRVWEAEMLSTVVTCRTLHRFRLFQWR